MVNIDSTVENEVAQLNEEDRQALLEIIHSQRDKLFQLGEFKFFDDLLFCVEYGFTTTHDERLVFYSRQICPQFSIDPPKIPGGLDLYLVQHEHHELRFFPTAQDIQEKLHTILQNYQQFKQKSPQNYAQC